MNFLSDNASGVSPAIMEALNRANQGSAGSYGADEITVRLEACFADVFEHEVAVFPVATGTAANSLALATFVPPWGAVICHELAHITVDEANAPEFYTGGAKLIPIPGDAGRVHAADLRTMLPGGLGNVHHAQPAAVSITQASEAGTLYGVDEIGALAELAHAHGLKLHMDGARFANAVAASGRSPAELTWRSGVDVLSFGATKNGAMAAEAVVFFDPQAAATFPFRRKRAGHLFSKMRFLSAQLDAYLADELWLTNAAHANRAAARLSAGLHGLDGVRLRFPVEANELFLELPDPVIDALLARGFEFYRWEGNCIRLVTAFNTPDETVDAFLDSLVELLSNGGGSHVQGGI